MNSATSNLVILTAEINGDKLTGTAIDGNIKVLFTVGASEVHLGLFVPEANLVVSGKFRLGRDAGTIGIAIASIIAVVSLPVATPIEVSPLAMLPLSPSARPRPLEARKLRRPQLRLNVLLLDRPQPSLDGWGCFLLPIILKPHENHR